MTQEEREIERLSKLLEEEHQLSEFRRERWENAELRLETVWNQAIEACQEKLGKHSPPCSCTDSMPCLLCWQQGKLTALKRLEHSHQPIRERLLKKHYDLLQSWGGRDSQAQDDDYHSGAEDMLNAALSLFGEKE